MVDNVTNVETNQSSDNLPLNENPLLYDENYQIIEIELEFNDQDDEADNASDTTAEESDDDEQG